MKGAIIALTLSAIVLASFTVAHGNSATELHPGWNLVAWSGEQVDGVEAAYGWNPTTQLFDRYFPDRPDVSTLTQLHEGQAYWILASESAVLSGVAPTPCPECPACAYPIEKFIECSQSLTQCEADVTQCTADVVSCRATAIECFNAYYESVAWEEAWACRANCLAKWGNGEAGLACHGGCPAWPE